MKIELKRISHSERLSEETNAFSADLYINGVKRGTVSNHGTGGPDDFSDRNAEKELNAYGASLPQFEAYGMMLTHNAETLVGDVLTKHLEEKQYRRWCKTKTVFRLPTDKEGEWRTINKVSPEAFAHVNAKYPGAEILNLRFA